MTFGRNMQPPLPVTNFANVCIKELMPGNGMRGNVIGRTGFLFAKIFVVSKINVIFVIELGTCRKVRTTLSPEKIGASYFIIQK